MSNGMLDSGAVFAARLKAVGIPQVHIDKLVQDGIDTMAKMAFLVSCQPGLGEDTPFVEAVTNILGFTEASPMSKGLLSALRRVWFESHTVALNEVKQRMEKTDDALPKRLPQPEREVRRANQQLRLSGLLLEGQLECSHALIDLIHGMQEDDTLRYVEPSACTHREAELLGTKKEAMVKLDASGFLKQTVRDGVIVSDASTEYRLRLCLQRRSLAFDQMDLLPYAVQEKYHNYLFDLILKPIPSSHKQVSIEQILLADRQIFIRMSETLRNGISKKADGSYPIALALAEALVDPVVNSMLQPMVKSSQSSSDNRRQAPYIEKKGKGKGFGGGGKGLVGSKGSGGKKGGKPPYTGMPRDLQGGHAKSPQGKAICFGFNLGGCSRRKTNDGCEKGQHVCCGCFAKEHAYINCPKKS